MASGIASRFALRVGVRIRARFSSRIFTPLDRVFIPKEQARRGDVARQGNQPPRFLAVSAAGDGRRVNAEKSLQPMGRQ
jgi:hypothetical protein